MSKNVIMERMKERVRNARKTLLVATSKKTISLLELTIQANQWHIDNPTKWA